MPRGPMTQGELERYAEMIVRGCIAFRRGDTLVQRVAIEHRELAVAIAEAAYRAGAAAVDVDYDDPRIYAAPPRSRTPSAWARSRSSTRPRGSARRASSTTTASSTRMRPRTWRSAQASRRPEPLDRKEAPRCEPLDHAHRRDDRHRRARGDGSDQDRAPRRARQRRSLADLI